MGARASLRAGPHYKGLLSGGETGLGRFVLVW